MNDTLANDAYRLDDSTGVWARAGYQSIAYSDGDETEQRLAKIVSTANDLSVLSTELRQHCTDWPSTYHLSANRANLLRPFQHEIKGNILEIGAGCGAITRYLGECGASVLALEGSLRRAAIARSRTRDLANVTVLAEELDRLDTSLRFDVITLIGVLEYANLFTTGPSAHACMLERVRGLLKPDGVLFIAIENQLGLKYFAGAPEDHINRAMYGIEGRYRGNEPQTFGRGVLAGLLKSAGYDHAQWLAPVPDYKLPASIVTEAGAVCERFDTAAFAAQAAHTDPQLPPHTNFSLALAWPEVFRNDLGLELANAFLIRATQSHQPAAADHTSVLAYHYSTNRAPQYCKETLFIQEDGGQVRLQYRPLTSQAPDVSASSLIEICYPSSANYIEGHSLLSEYVQALTAPEWQSSDIACLIERYVAMLQELLDITTPPISWNGAATLLPGHAFDWTPSNIMITPDGRPHIIDTEWHLASELSLGHLIFRSLLLILASVRELGIPKAPAPDTRMAFVQTVMAQAGYALSAQDIQQVVEYEASIQAQIAGLPADRFLEWHPEQPLAVRPAPVASHENAQHDMQVHIRNLEASITELQKILEAGEAETASLNQSILSKDTHIRNLEKNLLDLHQALDGRNIQNNMLIGEVQALRSSTSWKITAPLRWPVDAAKRALRLLDIASTTLRRAGGPRMALRKIQTIAEREGLPGIKHRLKHLARRSGSASGASDIPADPNDYAEWIRRYDTVDDAARRSIRKRIKAMSRKPLISVLMPVYDPPLDLLEQAVNSVRKQLYDEWELCIADDASKDDSVRQLLARLAREDQRIKVVYREQNGHISKATNSALELATGEFIALLDNDDLLSEHALFYVAQAIMDNPGAGLIYSDEDKLDATGSRLTPYFKPDWNPDLFLSHNLINHLGCYRASLVRELQGFREGYEGSQDYDLALRCIEQLSDYQIVHIPRVLYHWRAVAGSTALSGQAKNYALEAGKRALNDHFKRVGIAAQADLLDLGMYRVKYELPGPQPLVSIIIPTRNGLDLLKQCIDSIHKKTDYSNYEILVVDNTSDEPATLDYLAALEGEKRARVLRDERPFNFSALNNAAVRQARGDFLCLMNNDIEVINTQWLSEMISLATQEGVGAVGARLWYPDDTSQHSGIIIGLGGVAGHAHKHFPRNHPGYFGRGQLIQTLTAVTAACMVVRKSIYEEVGGLDDVNLSVAFNDVDFCLRVTQAGYRNVWTPYAELYHHESASRGYEDTPLKQARFSKEIGYMKQRWGDKLLNDPAYNPNLTICSEDFSLAWPPRLPH